MTDIKSPRILYIKGGLFVFLGIASSALLIQQVPTLRTAFLLAVCIWSFARAYYFAFYVVEHYVDVTYRFAGLLDFAKHAYQTRFGGRKKKSDNACK